MQLHAAHLESYQTMCCPPAHQFSQTLDVNNNTNVGAFIDTGSAQVWRVWRASPARAPHPRAVVERAKM